MAPRRIQYDIFERRPGEPDRWITRVNGDEITAKAYIEACGDPTLAYREAV